MSALVPASKVEAIVGVARHEDEHFARAVSSEETVYILHSHECVRIFDDLRECPFSRALDRGIRRQDWQGHEDHPVRVWVSVSTLRLIPMDAPEVTP